MKWSSTRTRTGSVTSVGPKDSSSGSPKRSADDRRLKVLGTSPLGTTLSIVYDVSLARSNDTAPAAHLAQVAVWTRLGGEGRLSLAAQLSDDVAAIARAGIAQRHPE